MAQRAQHILCMAWDCSCVCWDIVPVRSITVTDEAHLESAVFFCSYIECASVYVPRCVRMTNEIERDREWKGARLERAQKRRSRGEHMSPWCRDSYEMFKLIYGFSNGDKNELAVNKNSLPQANDHIQTRTRPKQPTKGFFSACVPNRIFLSLSLLVFFSFTQTHHVHSFEIPCDDRMEEKEKGIQEYIVEH